MAEQHPYDALDISALTTLLLNPDRPPDVHRAVLSALSRRNPLDRTSSLVALLESMVQNPGRYDQEVMISCIDLLATDPSPDATEAMLEVLPSVLQTSMDGSDALKPDFREYFYTALITRQREGDLEVWADFLPRLDARTLVAAMIDPAAGALEALEPFTLIDRLSEPQRTKALVSVIAGVTRRRGSPEVISQALQLIQVSSNPEQRQEGVEALAAQWEKAKRTGREAQASMLEQALHVLDNKPRSAPERLTGKRPWAP